MIPRQFLGIDITDWLIAVFTGVLAVLNGFLVFYNWRLSKATKIAAESAKEAANAAQKQALFAEKALLASELPDVYLGEFDAFVNKRGTWEVTSEIRSDRVTMVLSVHFKFLFEGSLDEKKVRKVSKKVSPGRPYVATVRNARIPEAIETLQVVVTIYYASPLGVGEMMNNSTQYWIHREADNTVRVARKDPKDRFKIKKLTA